MYRLKLLREQKKLNMKQAAEALELPYTTYVGYEKGQREPNSEFLIKAADFYRTTTDYILGATDSNTATDLILPLPKMKKVPLLGTIACGEPILATENIDALVNADIDLDVDFALKCKGDSMINARIFDGDIVYIRQQSDVDDGDIAAVLIADEATLKRVYKYPNKLVLRPENPLYDDMVYQGSELDQIRIIGRAIAFLSAVRSK